MENPCRFCIKDQRNHNGTQRYEGCHANCEHYIKYTGYVDAKRLHKSTETITYLSDYEIAKRVKSIASAKHNRKQSLADRFLPDFHCAEGLITEDDDGDVE